MPDKASWLASITATLVRHLLVLIGAVVTVAGFLSIIASSTVKNWLRAHSYLLFGAWLLTVVLALVAIDFLLNRRSARVEATNHDRESVARVISGLPADASVIVWLKDHFITKSIPIAFIDKLSNIADKIRLNVIGLDNPDANVAYRALGSAIESFINSVNWNMFGSERDTMERSYEWPEEQWRVASNGILENRTNLVNAYDAFLVVCHKNHIC